MAEGSPQVNSKHDQYKLTGVKVTDQILGSGSYTLDIVLDYAGLKCIGKKLHQALFMQGETTTKVRQLKEQCHLLSQIRHPNIVMFLGLFFQQSPILVMEYVPYHLASSIDQYGTLPNEVSYSILLDVALGLDYLHNQPPPIVHGELSASTILLTPSMTAKLLYLGVANILKLSQPEIRYMAKKGGSLAYVPPEVMTDSFQQYDRRTDIFSYGILIVHMFSGKEPDPNVLSANTEMTDPIQLQQRAISEAVEKAINSDYSLKELVLKCTNAKPELRPQAEELVKNLADMLSNHPSSFINKVEMLREIKKYKRMKKDDKSGELEEKIQKKKKEVMTQEQEIEKLRMENESLLQQARNDDVLICNIIVDLQKAVKHEPQDDEKSIQPKDDANVIQAQNGKPVMQDSPKETEKPKLYGPKPKVSPRKRPPGKEYVNVSPRIDKDIRIRASTCTTDLTSTISNSIADSSSLKGVRLGSMIGRGRFFEVWKGKWNGDTNVAIKKLKVQFTSAENIRDDIAAMKSFHHPNLLQFYAAGTHQHTLYLIMELTEGGSLLDYLRKDGKTLQFAQLIEKAEQIASGMAYLEHQNYVHQNLSACNVVLSKDMVCKVSDYGFVRLIKQVDEESSVPMFLPRITAPEAFLNGEFTIKSDVWSFGILLYELVTYGSLPYLEISNTELMKQLQDGYRAPCPENCEEKLYDTILSCWRERPDNRPTFETLRWQMEDYFSTDDDGYIYMRAKGTTGVH